MDVIEKKPVRLKVASILRTAILSGEIANGEKLSLTSTAERLKISRTPVREAFQLLASEGILELRMNREAVVKSINEEFVSDHFDMRRMLEGEAVFRAIRNGMDPKPLQQLQDSILADDPLPLERRYDAYNQDFHHIIWNGSGSRKLYDILELLWNGPSYSRVVGSDVDHARSIEEHGQIVDRLIKGDPYAGREIMHQHIDRSCHIVVKTIKPRQ